MIDYGFNIPLYTIRHKSLKFRLQALDGNAWRPLGNYKGSYIFDNVSLKPIGKNLVIIAVKLHCCDGRH